MTEHQEQFCMMLLAMVSPAERCGLDPAPIIEGVKKYRKECQDETHGTIRAQGWLH